MSKNKTELEIRTYTGIDALRIPFKIAPLLVTLRICLSIFNAFVPTVLLALSTANFVDTAIDILNGTANRGDIYMPLVLLLVVMFFLRTGDGALELIVARLKFALERKLVPAFLDARASLNYQHVENAESWELVGRVADKPVDAFQEGLIAYGLLIRCITAVASIMGLIVVQVWWAMPVILVFAIPLFWVALRAGKKNYDAEVDTRKYVRRHEYYRDVLTSREAVEERTLFAYGDEVTNRYLNQYEIARKHRFWVHLKQYTTMKVAGLSMSLIAILVALTLINPVITGQITPGMFMGIVAAVFGIVNTLSWLLGRSVEGISKSREYMKDLTSFLNLSRTVGAKDLPDQVPPILETLEFREVRFKYPTGDTYILDGLSFKLENGKHYAFVGTNGAGKTTIVKLLTGLYDEYDGEILINGKELRTYNTATLKSLFSVVYQDFARYQVSMADNIALGDAASEISDQKIKETAHFVELDEAIADLKNGIKTPLGKIMEDGVDLSGGQWQKVAIARSLISRAPLKILDEPTAALDPIAESRIYGEFESLMKGKTTIFISHRLGSTKLADEILVIENGSIIERGAHDDLMLKNGQYAQMFEVQRKWYENE